MSATDTPPASARSPYGDLARDDHRRFVDALHNGRIPGSRRTEIGRLRWIAPPLLAAAGAAVVVAIVEGAGGDLSAWPGGRRSRSRPRRSRCRPR